MNFQNFEGYAEQFAWAELGSDAYTMSLRSITVLICADMYQYEYIYFAHYSTVSTPYNIVWSVLKR